MKSCACFAYPLKSIQQQGVSRNLGASSEFTREDMNYGL